MPNASPMYRKPLLPAVVICLLMATSSAHAALDPAGELDLTFNTVGYNSTNFAQVNTFADARALAIQQIGVNYGKIVIGGTYQDGFNSHFALLRLNTDGTQDGAFGTGGVVKTTIGTSDYIYDLAIQSDDKIIAAGFVDSDYAVARYSPDGVLDTTFGGGDGIVVVGLEAGQFDRGHCVALQSDGKIVVGGYSYVTATGNRDMTVLRLNTNGSLDTSFSSDGFATVSLTSGGGERIWDIVVQPDQKIVAVGGANNPTYSDSVALRFNSNGSLDTGFSGDGIAVFNFATVGTSSDNFRGVTLQSDGKIVATGGANTTQDGSMNAKTNILVARMNTDGSLDSSFSGDGSTWLAIAPTSGFLTDMGFGVGIQSDGKVVVGAYTTQDLGGGNSATNFAVVRWSSAGVLDTTYDADGIKIIDFGADDTLQSMILDGSGRAVTAGYRGFFDGTNTVYYIAVARLTTAGALDTTFAGTGYYFTQLQGGSVEAGYAMGLQSSGKVIVGGYTTTGSGSDFALIRYNTNGTLDTTFDTDGKASGSYGTYNDTAEALAIQTDDKIVLAGGSYGAAAGSAVMTVMRFTAAGALDTTFDGDGVAVMQFGSLNNSNAAHAVAVQADGKIVAAGSTSENASDWNFAVARWNANGTPDTAFSGDGKVVLNLQSGGMDEANALAIQSDGKILVGGYYYPYGNERQFILVRLNANGSYDLTFSGDGIATARWGSTEYPTNEITGLAVLPDGRIVASGNCNEGLSSPQSNNVVCALRFNSNGSLDTTFDGDGIAITNLASDRFDRGYALGLQRDDKIVVFGHSMQLYVTSDDFLVLRYNWDQGDLDATFGPSNLGYTLTALSSSMDQVGGGWVTGTGVIYAGGTANGSDMGAARYQSDPTPVAAGTPDLLSSSDSGTSGTDNITNDNTPTFSGTCSVGHTTILKIDGAVTNPLARSLCRSSTYAVTAPVTADGVRSFRVFSRNGKGDSADSAALSVTIDTVAAAPTITYPVNGTDYAVPPSPTITGTGAEAGAFVEVRQGAGIVCTATANGSGAWSCASTLGYGSYSITARQTDIAGNLSAASTAVAFTLTQYADLSVAKTDGQTSDIPGTTDAYTITVSNLGPSDAPGSTVTDLMPAALGGVTWTCAASGGSTCTASGAGNINDTVLLKTGTSIVYTVTGTIDPSATGTLNNTASAATYLNAAGGIRDTVPGNNSAIDGTTLTPQADLSIVKTDSADPVNAASGYSYTLSVSNAGPSTATSLTVTDTLPAGVVYLSATGTGWTCGFAAPTVTCTRTTLLPGAAPAITLGVTAPNEGGPITNTCSVSSAVTDPVPGNNSASQGTTITPIADLSVTKTDATDPVTAEAMVTYTLAVSNAGPSTATSVTVTDPWPAGTTYYSAGGSGWACGHSAGVLTCTRASLAVGAAPAITFKVNAPATNGTITNTVTVSSAVTDPVSGNNSDSESTYICDEPYGLAAITAVDLGVCADTGVRITWAADPVAWGDSGTGTRTYDLWRDGTFIQTGIAYGTTSVVDTTGADGVTYNYAIQYMNSCGLPAMTATAPAADVIAATPTITGAHANACPGQTVPLATEEGMTGYQWLRTGDLIAGATASTYVADVGGNYQVRYTNGNGCVLTSPAHPVSITFCPTTEVSPAGSPAPLRLVKDENSPTGFYLYTQKVPSAAGYNLYDGNLDAIYSHGGAPGNVCSIFFANLGDGTQRVSFSPSSGNHYYLVTAFGDGAEGPSGFNSALTEIPAALSTCAP